MFQGRPLESRVGQNTPEQLKVNEWLILLKSLAKAILVITIEVLKSFLNPTWWFTKKTNPSSSFTRLPDRISSLFFRLDIVTQNIFGKPFPFIRRKWMSRLVSHLSKDNPAKGKVIPVEEFDYRSRPWDELPQQLNRDQRPLILKGFLKEDPLYEEWNLADLIAKYGEEEVLLTCPVNWAYKAPLKHINIPGVYLHNSEYLLRKYPGLLRKMGISSLAKLMGKNMVYLNIPLINAGRKLTGTSWHCAATYNCFLMLTGQKKWTFIDPEDSPLLAPVSSGEFGALYYFPENPKISKVTKNYIKKLSKDDEIKVQDSLKQVSNPLFSFYRIIDRYEVVVNPGDLLVVPPYWWHEVENLTPESIGVSTRWNYRNEFCNTNDVFASCTNLAFKAVIKVFQFMYKQNLFDRNGKVILTNGLNADGDVKELMTDKIHSGRSFANPVYLSESVLEYYKRQGFKEDIDNFISATSLSE